MAYCSHCGALVDEGAAFCSKCGSAVTASAAAQPETNQFKFKSEPSTYEQPAQQHYTNPGQQNQARDDDFDPADVEQNKVIALFAYLGILLLIPLLAAPNSRYARFHTNQGLVLFIVDIVVAVFFSIVGNIFAAIFGLLGALVSLVGSVASIALFVLSIMGIINAVTGKAKELPVIGSIRLLK